MNQSTEMKHLPTALLQVQGAIQPARKDSVNPHFKSRYADLTSVWEACKDALQAAGLAVIQLPMDGETGRCTLLTRLQHVSGEYIESTASVKLVKDDPQGYGSALTYLRRYMLMALLGITPDDDDDGNAASHPPRGEGASYREPAPKPAPKKSNGKGERAPAVRATMIERIGDMEQEAAKIGLDCKELHQEIMGDTRVSDATDTKLEEYGKALKSLIAGKMA